MESSPTPLALEASTDRTEELAYERRSGLDISLFWRANSNTLFMLLQEGGVVVTFDVPSDRGLDALAHPKFYQALSERK